MVVLWGRYRNLEILIVFGGNIKEIDDEGNDVLDFVEDIKCIKFLFEFESLRENYILVNVF